MSLLFEWDDRGTRRVILFDDFLVRFEDSTGTVDVLFGSYRTAKLAFDGFRCGAITVEIARELSMVHHVSEKN